VKSTGAFTGGGADFQLGAAQESDLSIHNHAYLSHALSHSAFFEFEFNGEITFVRGGAHASKT